VNYGKMASILRGKIMSNAQAQMTNECQMTKSQLQNLVALFLALRPWDLICHLDFGIGI
jgi:hypothetical protein